MSIPRYYNDLEAHLTPGKVLVIQGARQVGKTTLLRRYLDKTSYHYRLETGDDIRVQEALSTPDMAKLTEYVQGYDLLALDEAQRIPNIGQTLKLLVDQIPSLRVIATGSASFELAGQIGEPLTGRKTTLILYPVSQLEMLGLLNFSELKEHLPDWLIFGSYPAVLTASNSDAKRATLDEIVGSYLLRDILDMERVKGSKLLLDLLRLLAFQIGNEVSLAEIGTRLGIDAKTVARYLDLFEKSFVLYNLRGYSRNLRNEVTKTSKYYFYDNGIRNAIIANFNPLDLRDDIGRLWENFLVTERIKAQHYHRIAANNYFWRTWSQQEIDWLEERQGKLFGYEFKFSRDRASAPTAFVEAYPDAVFGVISRHNYLPFVTNKTMVYRAKNGQEYFITPRVWEPVTGDHSGYRFEVVQVQTGETFGVIIRVSGSLVGMWGLDTGQALQTALTALGYLKIGIAIEDGTDLVGFDYMFDDIDPSVNVDYDTTVATLKEQLEKSKTVSVLT